MKIEQPLNDTQRAVVEDMLPIAKWTVRKYITSSENISGLSYDVSASAAQSAVRQRSHRHLVKLMRFHISIAKGIAGTNIIFFSVIYRTVFIEYGCRPQECL